MAAATTVARQVPIVCPGHTRPLAELHFLTVENDRTLLFSACHGEFQTLTKYDFPLLFFSFFGCPIIANSLFVNFTTDRMPMVRDGTTGDWIGTFAGHKGAVWSCRVDPSGSLAATASGDFSVRVWDAITGASLWEFKHSHIVKAVDFSPKSQYLATGGHEGLLRLFDLTQFVTTAKEKSEMPMEASITIPLSEKEKIVITKVAWLNDTTLLVGAADGKVRIYQPFTKELVNTLNAKAEVRDLEISTTALENKTILTVAAGKTVYFWDATTWQLLKQYTVEVSFGEEGGASLHPSGRYFAAGGSDLWVRVFEYESGKQVHLLKGHHGPIRCVRYGPQVLATGSEDGTIRLWNLPNE